VWSGRGRHAREQQLGPLTRPSPASRATGRTDHHDSSNRSVPGCPDCERSGKRSTTQCCHTFPATIQNVNCWCKNVITLRLQYRDIRGGVGHLAASPAASPSSPHLQHKKRSHRRGIVAPPTVRLAAPSRFPARSQAAIHSLSTRLPSLIRLRIFRVSGPSIIDTLQRLPLLLAISSSRALNNSGDWALLHLIPSSLIRLRRERLERRAPWPVAPLSKSIASTA